jgi:hypothetical protein
MTKTPRKHDPDPVKQDISTQDELNSFINGLTKVYKDSAHEETAKQNETVRDYLQQFDRPTLQRLMGRAFIDALKSPHQKLGTAQPPSDDPAAGPETKPAGEEKKDSAN